MSERLAAAVAGAFPSEGQKGRARPRGRGKPPTGGPGGRNAAGTICGPLARFGLTAGGETGKMGAGDSMVRLNFKPQGRPKARRGVPATLRSVSGHLRPGVLSLGLWH